MLGKTCGGYWCLFGHFVMMTFFLVLSLAQTQVVSFLEVLL